MRRGNESQHWQHAKKLFFLSHAQKVACLVSVWNLKCPVAACSWILVRFHTHSTVGLIATGHLQLHLQGKAIHGRSDGSSVHPLGKCIGQHRLRADPQHLGCCLRWWWPITEQWVSDLLAHTTPDHLAHPAQIYGQSLIIYLYLGLLLCRCLRPSVGLPGR